MVVLSVTLDFVQEMRAENAVEALRRTVAIRVQVRRDGAEVSEPVDQLVPGDVVRLAAGDLVPADCRLVEARDLFVNQAMLTGEPYPAEKRCEASAAPARDPAEAVNTVFMGTSVLSGSAIAVVCRTGDATAFGQLSGTLMAAPPPTAFELGIRRFGFLILRLTVFLVLFVLAVNVMFHRPWLESLMFALALAVGLTPELLPMIVTVTLARGAMRLAGRRVIVKRLAAMHNIGAMDVLCTDKTGTLTEAKIRMVRHLDFLGQESERVFRLAYLNSHFESGIKSPLDDAILGVPHPRRQRIRQDRRGAVRLRAPPRLRPGRRRCRAPAGGQGRARGRAAAIDPLRGRGGRGKTARCGGAGGARGAVRQARGGGLPRARDRRQSRWGPSTSRRRSATRRS